MCLQAAARQLEASWRPRKQPLHGRGAALANPSATPHPVYRHQRLFSIYVHTSPSFHGYGRSSIFHGREIVPKIEAQRFTHSLGRIALHLLEAALLDTTVHNARFVTVSEGCVPSWNGGVIYLQLMMEARSRVGPFRPGGHIAMLRKVAVHAYRPRLAAFEKNTLHMLLCIACAHDCDLSGQTAAKRCDSGVLGAAHAPC